MATSDDHTPCDVARVLAIMEERDRRYEQRFADQQTAIKKAEDAVEKRFANVNELRGALDDAARLLMPRAESNTRFETLASRIDEVIARIGTLEARINVWQGEQAGVRVIKGNLMAYVGFGVGAFGVIVSIIVLLVAKSA